MFLGRDCWIGDGSDCPSIQCAFRSNILRREQILQNRMSSTRGPPQQSGPSEAIVMFEQTVNKSFEVIKTLLPKINSLYQLNEELQRSVSNFERKLTKLQMDNEDLHYELRTNKLALETKVSAIAKQYNLLANEPAPSRRHLDSAKSRHKIAEGKEQGIAEGKEQGYDSPVDGKAGRHKDRTRKIIFEDELVVRKQGKERQLKRRNSIQLEEAAGTGQAREHFKLHSNVSIDNSQHNMGDGSERAVISSERNIKNNPSSKGKRPDISLAKSSKSIKSRKEVKQTTNYASFLREIELQHFNNKKIKENYQKIMDQYCRQSDSKLAVLQTQIDTISAKIQQMDPHNNLLQANSHTELTQANSHTELTQHLQEFETRLNAKLDTSLFEVAFKDISTRLGSAHESIRKLANKEETHQAIESLQGKLKFVLRHQPPAQPQKNQPQAQKNQPQAQKNQPVHIVELDMKGCLKTTSSGHDHSHQNSRHTIRNHPAENTPRTLRNDERVKPKRLATSLHTSINKSPHAQARNNEGRLSLIVQKSDKQDQATVRLLRNSVMRESQINLLKQKSAAVLEAGKVKPKPRLRKERLIFQYD